MKPVIKYQGGKTKELSTIKEMLPPHISRVVEPFCGGAAVSFALGYPALLSDINREVINLYSVIADVDKFPLLLHKVNELKCADHDILQKEYYEARDVINSPFSSFNNLERAIAYVIVRQLCFSGMERYNAKGEFNVPFGHYQRFSCNLSPEHHKFIHSKVNLKWGDFAYFFDNLQEGDFVFIDPPYLERLGYTTGDGGDELHTKLYAKLSTITVPWMIIHSDHDFYREYYKDFNIREKGFNYSQRFGKDKDHTNAKVKHLYITNY